MFRFFAALLLMSSGLSAQQRAVLIDNEHVRVIDVTSPAGRKSGMHEHPMNRVMIYLTPGTNRIACEDGRVEDLKFRRGDALWSAAGGRHTSENPGTQPFRVIEVELKKPAGTFEPGPLDPVKLKPEWYRVVLDRPQARVLHVTIPGKASVPLHEHARNRVLVWLTDAHARVTDEKGAGEMRAAANDVRWAGTAKHSEENLSDKPFEVVVVELK